MAISIIEETKEVLLDNESPLGEKVPGAPFVVVALTYTIVFVVGVLGAVVFTSLF